MYEELKGKKLLVLGGVLGMIETVIQAKKMGVIVYVTDYLENSPSKKYADKCFMVSATDVDAVVDLCKKEKIDGIITGYVDMLLPYYAQICEKANLPCYGTFQQFQLMVDKKKFKDACRKNDVTVIPEYDPSNLQNVKFPVLVKPIDNSGSRGISVCKDEKELKDGIEKALSFSPSKTYLVEQYMTGDEAVLYYYFQDGTPHFIGMCDRYVNKEQYGVAQVCTAYVFPSRYTKNHLESTDKKIKNMCRNLKMKNGGMFIQSFIHQGVPCLYEPGYRLNGAREQHIFSKTVGIDISEMLIRFSLTKKMSLSDIGSQVDPYLNGKYACMVSPILREGVVSCITGIDEIKLLPEVKNIILINNLGSEITKKNLGCLTQIAYRAYVVADTIEQLKECVDKVQKSIVYYDQAGESMMLTPFDTNLLLKNYS